MWRKKEWIWSDTEVWYIKPLLLPDQQWRKENQYDFRFLLPPRHECMFYFISSKTISLLLNQQCSNTTNMIFRFPSSDTANASFIFGGW